jgi:integrase
MATKGSGQYGKITIADVRAALAEARGSGKRILIRDGAIGGVFLLAGRRGARLWLEYKPKGRRADGRKHGSKYLDLGSVDAISPDDARREGALAKHRILLGEDPIAERKQAQARATAPGWLDVRDDYLLYLRRRLRPSSYAREVASLKRVFEILDPRMPLGNIGPREVASLVDHLPAAGAVAHHCAGALGRLLDWARSRSIIDAAVANPIRLLPRDTRPKRPPPRQRVLSVLELVALWCAAEKLAPIERNLLRFLIALPLRRGEAAAIEWGWLDCATGTLTLPDKIMKNGQAHTLPLGALARQMLNDIAGEKWPTAGRVFKRDNASGIDWSRLKKRVDAIVRVNSWVFHDFRRSFVSLLAGRKHSETVLDLMLAHRASATRSGMRGVYQLASRFDEQKEAMKDWDRIVMGAIGGNAGGTDAAADAATVVPFPATQVAQGKAR